jgi:hypothetical protein
MLIPCEANPPCFSRHCIDCHNADSPEGNLDLTTIQYDPSDRELFSRWIKIHDRVQAGEMPPLDHEKLNDEEKASFIDELEMQLSQADRQRQSAHGPGVLRRLTGAEFETSLIDLLHIPLRIRDLLPPDATGFGFGTVGGALNMSVVQMESYLQAIDVVLDEAIKLIDRPPTKMETNLSRNTWNDGRISA